MHEETVWLGCTLIDGTGADPIANAALLVEDDKIVYAGPVSGLPATGPIRQVDLNGRVVVPGLIDCHVHLRGTFSHSSRDWVLEPNEQQAMVALLQARSMLDHGFTTIRDISRYGLYVRSLVAGDRTYGPRIIASGRGLSRSGGHGDAENLPRDLVQAGHPSALLADGPDEMRKAVRDLVRQGSEYIKIWATGGGHWEMDRETDQHYDYEEIETVVKEAAAVGLSVAAHLESLPATRDAIRAGVRTVEHGEELDEECIELMKAKGIVLVPTLNMFKVILSRYPAPQRQGLEAWPGDTMGEKEINRIMSNFKDAHDAGVLIAVGSDSIPLDVPFGEQPIAEIWTLVDAGMSPLEAITSATSVSALALNVADQTGSLAAGKNADFLVLDSDPLQDIRNLRKEALAAIVKCGKPHLSWLDAS